MIGNLQDNGCHRNLISRDVEVELLVVHRVQGFPLHSRICLVQTNPVTEEGQFYVRICEQKIIRSYAVSGKTQWNKNV